jgi:hypothetical protein
MPDQIPSPNDELHDSRPYEVGEVATEEWLARRRDYDLELLARSAAAATPYRLTLEQVIARQYQRVRQLGSSESRQALRASIGRLQDRRLAARLAEIATRYRASTGERRFSRSDWQRIRRESRAATEHLLEYAQIKRWRAAGESYAVIAARLGIDWWRDVLVIETMGGKTLRPADTARRQLDLRDEIRLRHQQGETQQALADAFGVSQQTISRWCRS